MRTFLVISLLVLAAAGCAKRRDDLAGDRPARAAELEIPAVSVDQLDRLLADHACQAVDANGNVTRQKMGIIPGAVLLRDADSIGNLPADKARGLVFYCANTYCGASHQAAAHAIAAGYTNVKILPDGIAGWVKAGKQTTSL